MPANCLAGVRHVCFDKDGTLMDVHTYWTHVSRLRADRLLSRFNLDPKWHDPLLGAMGVTSVNRLKPGGPVGYHPRATIVAAVGNCLRAGGAAAADDAIAEVFADIDEHQRLTRDYPAVPLAGVAELLGHLSERGMRLSLYTSDRRANAEAILSGFGVLERFDAVVGGDSVTQPKPHPEGFLAACRAVGVTPGESAYVGDTIDDVRMAREAGARSAIAVATGLDNLPALLRATPHAFADFAALMANAVPDRR